MHYSRYMDKKTPLIVAQKTTDTIARTLTDTLLYFLFLYGASFRKRGSRGIYEAFEQAQADMTEINYDQIKRALANLTTKKLLTRSAKRSSLEIQITKEGHSRINELFVHYRTIRPWDGHVYLISYDIPEHAHTKRNVLRGYIQKIGGARLQDSLWINPFNPQTLLEAFAQTQNINGTILISKLGKDGAIGKESLRDLIFHTYHLDALAKRYEQFMRQYEQRETVSRFQAALQYHAILIDDPQLPFELEPDNFPAKRAYECYQSSQANNDLI
jgi:DNA-binding transcriptional regulator PaaX